MLPTNDQGSIAMSVRFSAAAALVALLSACAPAEAQDLAELEEALERYEAGAAIALRDGAQCLAADRAAWEARRDACADVSCRRDAVLERLATLDGLQPGMAALENVALPDVPVLIAAIPPEYEAEGGSGAPLEREGALVWEQEDIDNMGFAVRDADGAAHVIVPDMDIGNSPNHDSLRALIEAGGDQSVLVRGHVQDGGFAMDACRLVYRLPGD